MPRFVNEIALKWNDGVALYVDPQAINESGHVKARVVPVFNHPIRTMTNAHGFGCELEFGDILVGDALDLGKLRERVDALIADRAKQG